MINVFYWPRELRLVIRGHADMGKYPPVCNAASALFYSLCTVTDGFRRARWVKAHAHLDRDGIGYCRIWSRRWYFKRCRVAMGMCVAGLMMLEEVHPGAIHVEVCTGVEFDDQIVLEENSRGGVPYLRKFCYDMIKGSPTGRERGKRAEGELQNGNAENAS